MSRTYSERRKCSQALNFNYSDVLTVKDGRGRTVEKLAVELIERGKSKDYVTFGVTRFRDV